MLVVRCALVALMMVGFCRAAAAQTVNQGQKIAWDHDGVGLAKFQTRIDNPDGWTDGGLAREYTIPALTPGAHTFAVRACNAQSQCSAEAALPFQMVAIIPIKPSNLRIVSPTPTATPATTKRR
jgi:hypothetical protein